MGGSTVSIYLYRYELEMSGQMWSRRYREAEMLRAIRKEQQLVSRNLFLGVEDILADNIFYIVVL